MRVIAPLVFLAAFVAGPVQADPYDLRGFKLGMTLEAFKALPYPDPGKYDGLHILCTGDPIPPKTYGALSLKMYGAESKTGLIRCMHFAPQRLGALIETKEATFNVAGVQTFVRFEFLPEKDGGGSQRLFRIVVGSNMMYWDQFWSAYVKKYGEPSNVEQKVVQNAYGATFPKILATWRNPDSSILLEQRDGKINTMQIVYMHSELAKEFLARLQKAEGGDPSKKL
jgi:hypothetical protein